MSSREGSSSDFEVVHRRASKGEDVSSGLESAEEATQTLMEMQKEAIACRDSKRRPSTAERTIQPSPEKQEKVAPTGAAESRRLTANLGAYWKFMKKIAPKINQYHRDAYRGSVFEHYIVFGAPAPDLLTLELLLRYYDGDKNTFSIPDSNSGAVRKVKFDLQWVHNHTLFPIYGEVVSNNRDSNSRIWMKYFTNLYISEEGKRLKKPETSQRKHLEGHLERLVESTETGDIQEFVLLQILYQCSMIWSPRAGEGIPRPVLRYLDSIERVKSVAWARFFYDEIIRGIGVALEGKKEQKKAYVSGCMTLLCHSLYGFEPSFYELFLTYIEKYTALRIMHLLIPLVRDDHWHMVEVDLRDDVVKHYSSAGHESWLEPVNKIIKFFDMQRVDFVAQNVRRVFKYEAVACEQQIGRFDCGVFVYLYIKAIIDGRPTNRVNPPGEVPDAMRARLATQLLIAGYERRCKDETVYSDE